MLEQMDQAKVDHRSTFPTAVCEEELREAMRKSVVKHIFGSSSIFLATGPRDDRPDLQATVIINNKALEHYENGEKAMTQSRFEKAVNCFSKAINLQPKQTKLYVRQGEAYLQMCDFQSAAVCYKQACILEPGLYHIRLAFIYYLQGQCLYDQGMFLDGLESFAMAAELKPRCRAYHIRSLACLTAMGRYSDCLLLVTSWLEEEKDSQKADLYTLRARLYKQLNQATACYCDLKAALVLNPVCPQASGLMTQLVEVSDAARQQAVSKALIGEMRGSLEKITKALKHSPEKEEIYLFRGTLYRRLKDFTAAIEDLVLAIELSKARAADQNQSTQEELKNLQKDAQNQLVLTYNDLAVQCFSQGYYAEATMLLTKAIQDQKEESGLYVNRGDCFFKQAEWEFALADYQQAEEMSPNDHAIWVRLAVIHNTLGMHSYQERKYQESVDRLSEAIRQNPGVALYYENRARAYQKISNMEKAKQDAVCTLILDPTNDQVVPLLLSMFPGCSLPDILASDTGCSVRAQLMDHMQASKSRTSSSATSGLDKINLNHDNRSRRLNGQSEEQAGEEEELLPCVCHLELNKQMAHSVLQGGSHVLYLPRLHFLCSLCQVKRAVQLALQCRQPLRYTGPRLAPVLTVEQETSALRSVERPYSWRKFGELGFNFI